MTIDSPATQTSTLTTFLAVWGAVVSTIAIAWNVWRDTSDRAKLDVICYVGDFVGGLLRSGQGPRLVWRVTNAGRKPAVLTHIGGALNDNKHFMIDADGLPRTLQPGDYFIGYSKDLSVFDEKPIALWAIDSLNHHWKIPRKMLRELTKRGSNSKKLASIK